MLSHAEAQALVSARLDGPLDSVAERVLNAHLATCPSCRAFNRSAGQLARSLQGLPYLPPSPAVSRAVLEHVNAPRSPWSRLALPGFSNALPALSAVALVVIFVGTFAVLRMLDDDERDRETLNAPTTNNVAQSPPTATAAPETGVSEVATLTPGATSPARSGATESSLPALSAPTETSELGPASADDPPTGQETSEPTTGTDTSGAADEAGSVAEPTAIASATQLPPTEVPAQSTTAPSGVDISSGPTVRSTPTATTIPTETPEPTATAIPTDVPTETPAPTATSIPTDVPTEPPEPTATTIPTEVPTETPELTATTIPTEVPTETPEPTATTIPTEVPTEIPEPTATAIPTELPTETPEPTATSVAGAIPTEDQGEPTSPPIESSDGTVVPADDGPDGVTAETPQSAGETPSSDDDGQTIVETVIPAGEQDPATSDDASTNDESGDGDESPRIEPRDGETPVPGSDDDSGGDSGDDGGGDDGNSDGGGGDDESGNGDNTGSGSGDDGGADDGNGDADDDSGVGGGPDDATGAAQDGGELSLADAGVYAGISAVPADPRERLGINADGALVVSVNPGRASLEQDGLTLESQTVEGGRTVVVCDGGGSCLDLTSGSATGSRTDTPLGWLNGEVIYERIDEATANPIAYRAVRFDATTGAILEDRLLGEDGFDTESILRPYPVEGGLLVLAREAWLFIDGGSVQARGPNPYGEGVGLIRIHPATGEISYVADGQLLIAPLAAPGSPTVQLPFGGIDYDLAPDGSQIVVSTGDGLQIVGRDGQVLTTVVNPDGIPIGQVAWLNEGIIFVDQASGQVRLLPFGP